jgi:hypothetical protein
MRRWGPLARRRGGSGGAFPARALVPSLTTGMKGGWGPPPWGPTLASVSAAQTTTGAPQTVVRLGAKRYRPFGLQ